VYSACVRYALLISRFKRTANVADIYTPVRSDIDIGYLGDIVKYIIDNELYDDTYIREHTNAHFKVNPDFNFDDGLFSGYTESNSYDKDSWTYQLDSDGLPIKADSLDDPD